MAESSAPFLTLTVMAEPLALAPSDPDLPPLYSEVTKGLDLDLDTLDKRRVNKARRRVKNIKIGVACLVSLLFLMSLM